MSDSEEDSSGGPEWPVTEEWILGVLKQHHDDGVAPGGTISVSDFTVNPGCDAGESVLSDILAVNVKYSLKNSIAATKEGHCCSEQQLSFIIKLLPQDPFSRFFVTEAQFDLREIKFYTQVVPDLQQFQKERLSEDLLIEVPIPKCYYANYCAGCSDPDKSPTPPESVLVLENIKPKGFIGADVSRGLTLRQASSALEAIARIHALSLCLKVQEKRSISERYPFLFQTAKATDSYQQLVERGMPQLEHFLQQKTGLEEVVEALNAIRPNTKELIETLLSPEEPLALITHTDFWCNNLMFNESDAECKCSILDWQMVTYSRATNDLALLLVSSVPQEVRRNHTESLLDGYWSSLTGVCARLGVNIEADMEYTRVSLGKDYRKSQLLALLLCIGSVDVALGDPITEERLIELLKDLHADGILNADIVNNPG